jgi:hypothetical protein
MAMTYRPIIKDGFDPALLKKQEEWQGACFMAGTLVHTDKGLVPIEQLKVGDRVLSRSANGRGELIYKAITKTIQTEGAPVFLLEFEPYIDPSIPVLERIKLRRALQKELQPSPLFCNRLSSLLDSEQRLAKGGGFNQSRSDVDKRW